MENLRYLAKRISDHLPVAKCWVSDNGLIYVRYADGLIESYTHDEARLRVKHLDVLATK